MLIVQLLKITIRDLYSQFKSITLFLPLHLFYNHLGAALDAQYVQQFHLEVLACQSAPLIDSDLVEATIVAPFAM